MKRLECTDCDGQGSTLSEDYDEHGSHILGVTCEACDGHGELVECVACREPMPADDASVYCDACQYEGGVRDQADEMARIARAS